MSKRERKTRDRALEDAGAYFAEHEGQRWVVIPFANGWVVAQRLAAQRGRLVVSELRVYPQERPRCPAGEWTKDPMQVPSGGLSATLLRRHPPIGPHAVAPVVWDWVAAMTGASGEHWGPDALTRAQQVAQDFGLEPPTTLTPSVLGRPGRSWSRDPEHFEKVAAEYRKWENKDPAKRIAEKWKVNRTTARGWIFKARHKLKLLPPTTTGRGSRFLSDDERKTR